MRLLDIEKLHGNIVKTSYALDMVNMEAADNISALVKTAESIYKKQIKDACKFIIKQNSKMIFISGPSAAGKTTTAKLLKADLKRLHNINAQTISLDDFFINIEDTPLLPDGTPDFENFEKIDKPCFDKFFEDIMTKGKAKMPEFDFMTSHRKDKMKNVVLNDGDVLIIEGTHSLNPRLIENDKYDSEIFKIYICVNSNFDIGDKVVIPAKSLRMMRRLVRNYFKRGESVEFFLKTWQRVLDGEEKFIKPFKMQADFLIDTAHIYEPLIYAYYLKDILNDYLKRTKRPNKTIEDILFMVNSVEAFDKSIIPNDSLLWEFFDK